MIVSTLKFNFGTRVRCVILFFFICFVLVYRVCYHIDRIEKKPQLIYVLQWTSALSEPISYMGKGVQTFADRKCPVNNCFVTSDRNMLGSITDYDVVIFHGPEIIGKKARAMPRKRYRNQIYVYASMESSGYYPLYSNVYDGYFNTTWTYKLDSDVYFGYFAIRNRDGELIGPSEHIPWINQRDMLSVNDTIKQKIASKKIAAAWFVSNCKTPSKREKLVEDMQKEMKVYGMTLDVYGYCGNKNCPRSKMSDCLKLLETDYYFYFAFENSFAEDYVTEKLLHALNNYAVPVVYGGADYKRFMPNGAYLDATVLTPRELAEKMFDIIMTPDIYHQFFKWHNHYSYHNIDESTDTDPFCKLCEYVNIMKMENRSSVITEFEDWWNPHAEQWNKSYMYTKERIISAWF